MSEQVTESELKVLRSLRTNHYGDGGEGPTWAWAVNESDEPSGFTGKTLSGICGSLAKKKLIASSGSGEEAWIELTDAGREIADRI
jgi:hypothetical protein